MGRNLALLFLLPLLVQAEESIQAFGINWTLPVKEDWTFRDGTLSLHVERPSEKPRRPAQYALADKELGSFTLEAEVMPEPSAKRNRFVNSLILVYAWKDKDHFNYVHISCDKNPKAPHHNGIFHVYGGDRVRMSEEEGKPLLSGDGWHKVRAVYDKDKGRMDVWVDGKTTASLQAVDLSLRGGRIGLGSFFDTGAFRNLKVTPK